MGWSWLLLAALAAPVSFTKIPHQRHMQPRDRGLNSHRKPCLFSKKEKCWKAAFLCNFTLCSRKRALLLPGLSTWQFFPILGWNKTVQRNVIDTDTAVTFPYNVTEIRNGRNFLAKFTSALISQLSSVPARCTSLLFSPD